MFRNTTLVASVVNSGFNMLLAVLGIAESSYPFHDAFCYPCLD
jgi:hypothetical protein